jgi:hypothetical protein
MSVHPGVRRAPRGGRAERRERQRVERVMTRLQHVPIRADASMSPLTHVALVHELADEVTVVPKADLAQTLTRMGIRVGALGETLTVFDAPPEDGGRSLPALVFLGNGAVFPLWLRVQLSDKGGQA